MKYLITAIFASVAIALSLITGWAFYQVIYDGWEWLLVGIGLLFPTVVSVLITSAALSAARDY